MIQKKQISMIVHAYVILTVIGFLIWIRYPGTHLIELFGCHTVLYLFLVSLLIGDLGWMTLARVCFILWPVYILALFVCYLIAALKKKYIPLAAIALIDVLFSVLISLRYLQIRNYPEGVGCLFGMLLSLFTAIMLLRYSKQRMIHSSEEIETNP